jgi:hypothetical protein
VELPLNYGRRIISKKDEGRVAMSDPDRKYFTMTPSPQVTRMLEANDAMQSPEGAFEPSQEYGSGRRADPKPSFRREWKPEDDKLGRLASFIEGNYPANPQLANQIIQLADAFQDVVDRANKVKRDEGRA